MKIKKTEKKRDSGREGMPTRKKTGKESFDLLWVASIVGQGWASADRHWEHRHWSALGNQNNQGHIN